MIARTIPIRAFPSTVCKRLAVDRSRQPHAGPSAIFGDALIRNASEPGGTKQGG